MDELQIKNLIKVWRGKAFRERDPFSKFLFLWICFNAWLEHESGEDRDADMINWLITQTPESSSLVESYEVCRKKNDIKTCLKFLIVNSPFEDSRGQRHITVRDEDDFENIVRAIYRIRCNLFHGGTQAQSKNI